MLADNAEDDYAARTPTAVETVLPRQSRERSSHPMPNELTPARRGAGDSGHGLSVSLT